VSFFIAIVGLLLLILIHEAGHFFASLAVGLRPRRFFVGFPPAIAKYEKNDIEYAIGAIPLGGFVTIPGMHRPIPHDAERRFSRAEDEAPALVGAVDRVKRALEGDDLEAVSFAVDDFEAALHRVQPSPGALAAAEKGITELRDALGSDAYWKAPTWKRLVAIGAGPAANIVLTLVIFAVLFTQVGGDPSRTIASVSADSPAETAGLQAGDRVIAVDGDPVDGVTLGERIVGSEGAPLRLTVVRDGEERTIVVTPVVIDGGYRIGIIREGTGVPPLEAVKRSFEVTGIVSKEITFSIGRLFTGEGRDEVSSPIGITRVSSEAAEEGFENYLWVLGLISLSLALLNLLPLLPLDGGHILFTLIEGARGKFLQREVYERVSVIGLAVVLLLFFVGLSNDIGKLS
jgi:regulator of sigma E protease